MHARVAALACEGASRRAPECRGAPLLVVGGVIILVGDGTAAPFPLPASVARDARRYVAYGEAPRALRVGQEQGDPPSVRVGGWRQWWSFGGVRRLSIDASARVERPRRELSTHAIDATPADGDAPAESAPHTQQQPYAGSATRAERSAQEAPSSDPRLCSTSTPAHRRRFRRASLLRLCLHASHVDQRRPAAARRRYGGEVCQRSGEGGARVGPR